MHVLWTAYDKVDRDQVVLSLELKAMARVVHHRNVARADARREPLQRAREACARQIQLQSSQITEILEDVCDCACIIPCILQSMPGIVVIAKY